MVTNFKTCVTFAKLNQFSCAMSSFIINQTLFPIPISQFGLWFLWVYETYSYSWAYLPNTVNTTSTSLRDKCDASASETASQAAWGAIFLMTNEARKKLGPKWEERSRKASLELGNWWQRPLLERGEEARGLLGWLTFPHVWTVWSTVWRWRWRRRLGRLFHFIWSLFRLLHVH